jgi:dihydropteroate synthase
MWQQKTINCRDSILDLSTPKIMGIINLTSDSFYEDSRVRSEKSLIELAEKHFEGGASILDLGGMSSRPSAGVVDPNEESKRIVWALNVLQKRYVILYSVDTIHASVAEAAVDSGAHMINDISAGNYDSKMIPYISKTKTPYIAMHMKGLPATMQEAPFYSNVSLEVFEFFVEKIQIFNQLGIQDVILDVGFGFGKTIDHNYQLLRDLDSFKSLGRPMLVGLSRKSMIYKLLDLSPEDALNGTTSLHTLALIKGADILRVHDAKEASEVIKLFQTFHR